MPEKDRKAMAILRVLEQAGEPLGSSKLAEELSAVGIDLTERAIRYHLQQLDEQGLTVSLGRQGRQITELGRDELANARVSDKVALVLARLEQLAFETTLDLRSHEGKVVLNVSLLPAERLGEALEIMRPVFAARLCTSDLVALYHAGHVLGELTVPAGMVALGTVCSVTVNGVLLNYGVSMHSEFGGLLELENQRPLRFTDIIHYDGTSLDPLEIFIKGRMTSVTSVLRGERGKVGAGFRLIPAAALDRFLALSQEMLAAGIHGVAAVGRPGQPLLDLPVPIDRVGIILYAGLNPGAALEEAGIETRNKAMTALVDYKELRSFHQL
jgi:repressor of nif and glnA expression